VLLKLALVAASVLLASLAARRFGHAVGGTLAGLPMIAGPIIGFVLLQQPVDQARAIALATLVCLPATIAHMLAFAWCAARWHWGVALLAANAAFVVLGALLGLLQLPAAWACSAALAAPALGLLAMPRLRLAPSAVAIPRVELACRVAAAVVVAWVIVRSAGVVPAALSGLLLAIPITGNVLPCFTLPRHGAAATVALLAGFVRGLFGFAAFFVVLYVGLGRGDAGPAYAAAWVAALLTAGAIHTLHRRHTNRTAVAALRDPA
jgi:hypothetical protein